MKAGGIHPCPGACGSRLPDPEAGVSEVVGVILLIGLAVTAVAIVAVVLFSQATPDEIPEVNFLVGSNAPPTMLYLYHNGGDMLRTGTFQVLVDGAARPYSLEGGGEYWALGDRLDVDISALPEIPRSVTLVYNATGQGAVAIHSASANFSAGPGPVSADVMPSIVPSSSCLAPSDPGFPSCLVGFILQNTSVIGDAMNQSPQTVGPVIANTVQANSTIFFKDNKVQLDRDNADTYYFRFRVTRPGSSISATGFTPVPYPLQAGDIVTVYLKPSSRNFRTFGLGDQIWELAAYGVTINVTRGSIVTERSGDLDDAWITGYRDLGSTLKISTTSPNDDRTVLIMNGTEKINGLNSDAIVISDIRPVGIGLFVLHADDSANTLYFVGNARRVTINGAVQA
ncbi:MAG TPA: type IV pilin N-terminal domain-containing protein [Methanoregulaceae archaeon]|nr:type IV pilin N-terminal domain-containing protein [Methanoregulaceae archaeon]HPD75465.1 type IV pilin N-terminal domain-containing protein [Methanoregulaceae archaeon]HRY75005.1 type IV pilin N-terminal domain-containing protein [Methanoregulaceae archaeon]